jgi:hypothetical protein
MRRHKFKVATFGCILLLSLLETLFSGLGELRGRVLADSALARIRGASSETKQDGPVYDCAFINTGTNEVTPAGCRALTIVPPGMKCVICSDVISTSEVSSLGAGIKMKYDGIYDCVGQKSTAPCTTGANGGVCGSYTPVPQTFCDNWLDDWDPQ